MERILPRAPHGVIVHAFSERQPVEQLEVVRGGFCIERHAFVPNPGLARDHHGHAHARQFDARLRPVDDHAVALQHRRVGAHVAVRRDDENIARQLGKGARDFFRDELARAHGAADFRRMHADDELQFGPPREVADRLHDPFEHVRKSVRGVMQLRVPDDIREQADARLGKIDADFPGDFVDLELRLFVKPNPVLRAGPAALEVVHEALLHRGCPRQFRPDGGGLVHQRVVVGGAVAEDEALLAIGRIPIHHAHAARPRRLADEALRYVDAVVENRRREAAIREQTIRHARCEDRRREITSQHRLGDRRLVEHALRKKAQRPGECVFADGHVAKTKLRDFCVWYFRCDASGFVSLVTRHPITVAMHLQPEPLVHRPRRRVAGGARVGGRPAATVLRDVGEMPGLRHLAGGEKFVAQQNLHIRSAQGQRRSEQSFRSRARVETAHARRHQNPRPAFRSRTRGGPGARITPHQRAPVGVMARRAAEQRGCAGFES